jgi:putative ABC transport system permease protein
MLSVVWSYAAALVGSGCLLGLDVGCAAARVLSSVVASRTDIAMAVGLGWPAPPCRGVLITALLALLPAFAAQLRPAVGDLRAA